jgi:hypothetical protein
VGDQLREEEAVWLSVRETLPVRDTEAQPEGEPPPWWPALAEARAVALAHSEGLVLGVRDSESVTLTLLQAVRVREGEAVRESVALALTLAQSVGKAEGEQVVERVVVTVEEALGLPPAREGVAQGVDEWLRVPEAVPLRLAVPQAEGEALGERE